jgi:hypothetical protein
MNIRFKIKGGENMEEKKKKRESNDEKASLPLPKK